MEAHRFFWSELSNIDSREPGAILKINIARIDHSIYQSAELSD